MKPFGVSAPETGRLFTAGVIERVRLPLRAHEATNEATNHKRSFVPSTRGSQITARTRAPQQPDTDGWRSSLEPGISN